MTDFNFIMFVVSIITACIAFYIVGRIHGRGAKARDHLRRMRRISEDVARGRWQ